MNKILIKEASIVNEGKINISDILIWGDRIEKISDSIYVNNENTKILDAGGLYLFPGLIDDQVHFREPGLTHKADIYFESIAAVSGGITSFMDMPNTIPNVVTIDELEKKYQIASHKSLANYSFFMGATKYNLEEVLRTNPENVCGITDDGLYVDNEDGILANHPDFLEKLFSRANTLIALHCEDNQTILANTKLYKYMYGDDIPVCFHPLIRDEEACIKATERVLNIARKYNTRLHLLHISTLAEANLLDNKIPIKDKRITAEACVHHLWFSDKDYERLGSRIKWNPSIKSEKDRTGLLEALLSNKLDIIATDHAPHLLEEKSGNYFKASSGAPLVQHALCAMLELYHDGKISLEQIATKTSHNVAEIYRINDRGYIREGYYADLVLVDLNKPYNVTLENILYKCAWSPFLGDIFRSSITHTLVNGNIVYENGQIINEAKGKRLKFQKLR